jgi:hypothetical protein
MIEGLVKSNSRIPLAPIFKLNPGLTLQAMVYFLYKKGIKSILIQ